MKTLVMALYAEGRSDERFLPLIIQRTAANLLAAQAEQIVDVLEPMIIEPPNLGSRAENILSVARQVQGYHLLLVHADADAETQDRATDERIQPGFTLVRQAEQRGERICADHIPMIPVQMTEAWMLCDVESLRDVIGTQLSAEELGMPLHAHQIERLADPKAKLNEVIRSALSTRSHRRRSSFVNRDLFEPLGQQIRLDALRTLPSYQRFVADLQGALQILKFLKTA